MHKLRCVFYRVSRFSEVTLFHCNHPFEYSPSGTRHESVLKARENRHYHLAGVCCGVGPRLGNATLVGLDHVGLRCSFATVPGGESVRSPAVSKPRRKRRCFAPAEEVTRHPLKRWRTLTARSHKGTSLLPTGCREKNGDSVAGCGFAPLTH